MANEVTEIVITHFVHAVFFAVLGMYALGISYSLLVFIKFILHV